MGRKPSSSMQGHKKGSWSEEEDRILFDFVRQHGERDWHSLPQRAGLLRCGKSCRLRWANYLRPGIRRGDFSPEEEETIIRLQASLGNRWATIARHLYRRTDNEIKNFWNTRLKTRAAKSCTTIASVGHQISEQSSITPTDYNHVVLTEIPEDNVAEKKIASSTTSHNLVENEAILCCPNNNTENTSEQGCETAIISKSGPTISRSARVLNKIASNTRLLDQDLRRILINDGVKSMAYRTTVSPSNTNELMFKRRMQLWQSFDIEDIDLDEYFFLKVNIQTLEIVL